MSHEYLSATSYFQKLCETLLATQVTELSGGNLVEAALDNGSEKAVELILSTKSRGAKVMVIGNGGSAAIASHIQNDLCDSAGIRAIVFNDIPFLTAISNDHGYEKFFEQAVKLWAEPQDILIAISSSGRSASILRAVQLCRLNEVQVITFSGFLADNPLRKLGNLNFYVPSQEYGFVETAHAALGHFLTDCAIPNEIEIAKH